MDSFPLDLENERQPFLFCCHMLSGNCQTDPYIEQWMRAHWSWTITRARMMMAPLIEDERSL